jgi:PilZ domain
VINLKGRPASPIRRSARVQIRIPVTISGSLAGGSPFVEDTYVVSVSKFGAKIRTQHPLEPGMEIRVKPRTRREDAPFEVVWVGREGTLRAGEIGVQYVKVSSLLGVWFPD